MKVTHICLCGPVTDNFSYQDNLLSKYHKRMGLEVSIIASQFIYNEKGEIVKDNRVKYINENNIKMIRLESSFNTSINSKFKKYKNVYSSIENEDPDILFVHGVQFIDLNSIIKFKKKNPKVKVFIDNHADLSNSATNWLSKNILHKLIWRYLAKKIEPYTCTFFGVLPARVNFLIDVYKIEKSKVELLVMGADDDKINQVSNTTKINEIRSHYHIKNNDFLIVTGGKIDNAKRQTLLLMKAVQEMDSNVKLMIFGSIDDHLKEEFFNLVDGQKIIYLGWLDSTESYQYFAISNIVVFPGRHSVYWEQVAGLGKPMIVKFWEGTTHIDMGGNVRYLYNDTLEEIKSELRNVFNNSSELNRMTRIAKENGAKYFLYSQIARSSIKISN